MNKNLWRAGLILGVLLLFGGRLEAQENKPVPQSSPIASSNTQRRMPEVNSADVATLDGILKAMYEVISGAAGQKRDWNRFRSLYHPGARMIPTGIGTKTKKGFAVVMTPEEYIERNTPFFEKEGFYEREIARRVETFGTITHVFSTYEARHKLSDEKPFIRGVNSIQFLNDGTRWWVLTVAWSPETPEPLFQKSF